MNHETKQVIYNGVLVEAIDFGPVAVDPCQAQQRLDAAAAIERRGAEENEYCIFGCHRKVYRGGWCVRCWEEEHS